MVWWPDMDREGIQPEGPCEAYLDSDDDEPCGAAGAYWPVWSGGLVVGTVLCDDCHGRAKPWTPRPKAVC